MQATCTEGPRRELEISASAEEWLAFADQLDAASRTIKFPSRPAKSPREFPIRSLLIRTEDRPQLLISVDPAAIDASIAGRREHLEQFARMVRLFAQKSRRGQADPIENRGAGHFIDPASVLTLFHLGGEDAPRHGDVGG
ncbi:MAG: hypothetical protein FD180_3571 [Planctomycetota bacterium]|nr:MAG: hypothetical protein FD180_3571 [Planctomycetota bacterium]